MKKTGHILIMLMALYSAPSFSNELSMSIGLNLFDYPELELMPGYPVYYAPQLDANYFFYDGDYWVYYEDNWYQSPWYDGPWELVDPEDVPVFILRIPVRYYRSPPVFFFGWISSEPPHWGEHWGHDWEQHRHGWDKWDHRIHVKPAPLPVYQREYSGDRYPRQEQQQLELQQKHYHYQPRFPLIQHPHQEPLQSAPVQWNRVYSPERRGAAPQDTQRAAPPGNPNTTRSSSPRREVRTEPPAVQQQPRMQGSPGSEESRRGDRDGRGREPERRQEGDRERYR